MELVLDPAAFGGLAGLIAVTSWVIGRAQSSLLAASRRETEADEPSPVPSGVAAPPAGAPATTVASLPAPCQQVALEERRAVLAYPFVLAELHAEVSAIRRDERVLAPGPGVHGLIALSCADVCPACRFMGVSGQPTCPATTRSRCAAGHQCHPVHNAVAASGLSHRL